MGEREDETATFADAEADEHTTEEPPTQVTVRESDGSPPIPQDQRYERERLLGEGGMGTVILAHDATIGRRVALKELREGKRKDGTARARFQREARLQGQLEHPAVVPVYDAGVGKDGSPFFTMKRVRGQSLAEILATLAAGQPTRFSLHKLLTAFGQLCLAVHYAHERGVVHRDIKPSNVMLGAYGEVYLLDWGIAKIAHEKNAPSPSQDEILAPDGPHTGLGTLMGSLTTIAPEQAVGAEVDARADVYALGAVLFEILTHESLHPKGTVAEVVAVVSRGVEGRPSVRKPSADVPPELEAIVVRATKLHPSDRFPTALALYEALEAYLEGDRDLQLRRDIAKKHADLALSSAEEALRGDAAARETALGEVGRALALDPDNDVALATMVRLLTTPPKEVPPEVLEAQDAALRRRMRIGAAAGAALYAYVLVNAVATAHLSSEPDTTVFLWAEAGWTLAFLASLMTAWRPRLRWLLSAYVMGLSTSVYLTVLDGPFIVVPSLIGVHVALYALVRDWKARFIFIGLAIVGWTVSVFGELWGFLPDVVRFAGREMTIRSPVHELPETGTTVYLYTSVLAAILAPAFVIGALRAAWARNDDAMRLQAWQLEKLVSKRRS